MQAQLQVLAELTVNITENAVGLASGVDRTENVIKLQEMMQAQLPVLAELTVNDYITENAVGLASGVDRTENVIKLQEME